MKRSSLEPPRRAASNGGSYILLCPLNAEIFNESSTIWHLAFNIYVTALLAISLIISASNGHRRMKLLPFDAAQRGGSNELRCILLQLLDAKIFNETSTIR